MRKGSVNLIFTGFIYAVGITNGWYPHAYAYSIRAVWRICLQYYHHASRRLSMAASLRYSYVTRYSLPRANSGVSRRIHQWPDQLWARVCDVVKYRVWSSEQWENHAQTCIPLRADPSITSMCSSNFSR